MREKMAVQRVTLHESVAIGVEDDLMSVVLKSTESMDDEWRNVLPDEDIFGNLLFNKFVG